MRHLSTIFDVMNPRSRFMTSCLAVLVSSFLLACAEIGPGGDAGSPSDDQPTPTANLYFSEYVEGSGSNKALEILNADTNSTADLSLVSVEIYLNGATSASRTVSLPSGNLAPGALFVLANSGGESSLSALADATNDDVVFNGDDAVVLRYSGEIVDVIGQIGSSFPFGENQTLQRNCAVALGDRDASDPFDATAEFSFFAEDTFTDLGIRSCP